MNKKIYKYDPTGEGKSVVYGDPLEIHLRLRAACSCLRPPAGEDLPPVQLSGLNDVLIRANSSNPIVRLEGWEDMIRAAGFAFDMVPHDKKTNEGVTWEHINETLKAFLAWEEALKKNGEDLPNSSSSSASTHSNSAASSSPVPGESISPTVASGTTEIGPDGSLLPM